MCELRPAVIRIANEHELLDAIDFLEENGAHTGALGEKVRDSCSVFWQGFQPGGVYEGEGSICLRIGKFGSVDHSGENFYLGVWRETYNHGIDYVPDEMFLIHLDEYILACGGTPIGSEFYIACEAEFAEMFASQILL